jgi:phosphate-selective porin O/P
MTKNCCFRSPAAVVLLASVVPAAFGYGIDDTNVHLAREARLMQDAGERSSFLTDKPPVITLGGQLQFRYQANFRDSAGLATADNDTTIGFVMRRSKIFGKAKVTDDITAHFQFAFDRKSGTAALETAEISWKLGDGFKLRMGQFKSPLLREELVSSKRQLASERSAVNETFNQDFSQGVEIDYTKDKWRGAVMVSDGFGTDNTAFNSATEADFAVTGRVEFLLGEASFKQFKQFTSFRGATRGAMIGVAGHWQTRGDTNPSLVNTVDQTTVTADFSFVGSGWNVYAAGIWRNRDVSAVTSADDFGVIVQGGVFITDDDEIFGRYDGFFPDDYAGATDFNSVTFGWNHYFSPESHAAKFTVDCTYHLDVVTGSGIKTSDGHNLLADTNDGQFGIIAQMQLVF